MWHGLQIADGGATADLFYRRKDRRDIGLFGVLRLGYHGGSCAFDRRRFPAKVVELEPAERTPVHVRAEVFLEIAQWVLIHRVNLVDSAELLYAEAATAGAAACPSEQKQEPLILCFSAAAAAARPDGVISELLIELAAHSYIHAAAALAIPHL
jgi:hypothetical protein